MSPNLFAFLQKGARTVQVSFQGYEKTHTYLTTDDLVQVGAYVVVPYQPKDGPERLSVGIVKSADTCVKLSVDASRCRWVIDRVSFADETARVERETVILNMIEEAERRAMVKKLVDQTAESLLPEDRNTLLALIGD